MSQGNLPQKQLDQHVPQSVNQLTVVVIDTDRNVLDQNVIKRFTVNQQVKIRFSGEKFSSSILTT